jgi:hypothetical protein
MREYCTVERVNFSDAIPGTFHWHGLLTLHVDEARKIFTNSNSLCLVRSGEVSAHTFCPPRSQEFQVQPIRGGSRGPDRCSLALTFSHHVILDTQLAQFIGRTPKRQTLDAARLVFFDRLDICKNKNYRPRWQDDIEDSR